MTILANGDEMDSQIFIQIHEDHHREVDIVITDVEVKSGVEGSWNPLLIFSGTQRTSLTVTTFEFNMKNFISSPFATSNGLSITFENIIFQDFDKFGDSLMELNNIQIVNLSNFTIDNCLKTDGQPDSYVHYSSPLGKFVTTDIKILNMENPNSVPIKLSAVNYIRMFNSTFENLLTSMPIISTPTLQTIDINGIEFKNISAQILFDFTELDLKNSEILNMSNIVVSNSTTPALQLERINNHNGTGSTFTMSNFEYHNSTFGEFDTPTTLFTFTKLQHDFEFEIILNNFVFSNLQYGRIEQFIFEFHHQLRDGIVVNNLRVQDTINVHILFSARVPSLETLPTKVVFNNFTTDHVNAYTTSFMQMESGSRIFIHDSQLKQIFNFATGAVLQAIESNSEMDFYNTIFEQNSAIRAALFEIDASSLIKMFG